MISVETNNLQASTAVLAYATNAEHIQDELKRLDVVIQLQLAKQRFESSSDSLSSLGGLVLSEEEINRLVGNGTNHQPSTIRGAGQDATEQEALQELRQIEFEIQQRCACSNEAGTILALLRLEQIFHLTPFELNCVLLCLAPELDRKYEKLYAYLQDDITRKKPTVDLALSLFCADVAEKWEARAAFNARAPLIKYRLLQLTEVTADGPTPLLARALKLDDRIVSFLLGLDQADGRLADVTLPPGNEEEDFTTAASDAVQFLQTAIEQHFHTAQPLRRRLVIYLHGPRGTGKQGLAQRICQSFGFPLLRADLARMQGRGTSFDELAWLLGREALLQPTALCLRGFDSLLAEGAEQAARLAALLDVLQELPQLTFLIGRQPWRPQGSLRSAVFLSLEFPVPDELERRRYWQECLTKERHLAADMDPNVLAGKFRLTPGQIRAACVAAGDQARCRNADEGCITLEDLTSSCRAQSQHHLDRLARKVHARYGWKDIVLPEDRLQQLREISHFVAYRTVVYGDWGFDRKLSLGKGLSMLFAGPSGTGKTMAAEILARELGLDLYKIDLSTVVSKYIGETEKNLSRIFTDAAASNAILFFDEADALFGKRSEVKDAHDRYANVEVGYLLQKMEEYEGVVILATNLRKNLDDAFVRRLQFTVEFPFPGAEDRRRIWECVWPPETPRASDLDLDFLARRFELAGGNIRNVALAAAFLAAADRGLVTMAHILHATRREYQKIGKVVVEAEFRGVRS